MSPVENIEETLHRRQAGAALRRWAEQGRRCGVVQGLTSAVSTPGTAKGHVTEHNVLNAGFACAGGARLPGWAVRTETELEPAKTAVSVVREVLAVRQGRSGGSLATAAGRIGG